MGSDDFHHKRKAKSAGLTRRKPTRKPYDKVLIVCEGSKTEPLYFQELVDHYEIHSANVKISGDCGSDPLSVVNHGFELYRQERQSGSGPFNRVYCVFDRDTHPTYKKALERLEELKPNNVFFAANTVPSFEYWLLLHFTYTTAPYAAVGGKSSGAAVLAALKSHWPDYAKASAGAFSYLLHLENDELGHAKANARRALFEAKKNHTDNPSTHVHELVDYLQAIKSSPQK